MGEKASEAFVHFFGVSDFGHFTLLDTFIYDQKACKKTLQWIPEQQTPALWRGPAISETTNDGTKERRRSRASASTHSHRSSGNTMSSRARWWCLWGGGSLEESDQIHSNNKSTPKRGKIQWKRRWHMPNFAKLMINVEKVRLVFLFQHQKNNNNNERTEIPMKFAVTFVLLVFLSLHPSKTTNILTRSF